MCRLSITCAHVRLVLCLLLFPVIFVSVNTDFSLLVLLTEVLRCNSLLLLTAEAFLHVVVSVSVYRSSVSMATEATGLACDERRVYLDAVAAQTQLKSLAKQQADLEAAYLLTDGCRAAAAAAVVVPPTGKPGLEQPGYSLHCGQIGRSKA